MNIGGYHISGISKRFWYILAGFVFLLFLFFYISSTTQEPEADPLVAPAFSTNQLPEIAQQPGWIENYISDYGLQRPENFTAFTGQYSLNLGLPFRFRAYIPTTETASLRPSLTVNKFGWQFLPAIFLDPTQSVNTEELDTLEAELAEGQPMVLGFPENQTPAAGQAYEISGILYWNSNQLKQPTSEEEQGLPTSPIVLAASARALAATELEAPTTHRANLNIIYQERNQQLDIKHLEWSSGRQVRLCVSLTNVGSANPLNRWIGLDSFRAEYVQSTGQGSSEAIPDVNSPLANQQLLDQGSTITGYIIFDAAPSAAPSGPVTLFVPPLGSLYGGGIPTSIDITPDQFTDISESDHNSKGDASGGCY